MQEDIGQEISPDNIVEAMLRGEDIWNCASRIDLDDINIEGEEQIKSEPLGRRTMGLARSKVSTRLVS